jgi:hypothetical protein
MRVKNRRSRGARLACEAVGRQASIVITAPLPSVLHVTSLGPDTLERFQIIGGPRDRLCSPRPRKRGSAPGFRPGGPPQRGGFREILVRKNC